MIYFFDLFKRLTLHYFFQVTLAQTRTIGSFQLIVKKSDTAEALTGKVVSSPLPYNTRSGRRLKHRAQAGLNS